ncbi:MAG: hypothetical protein AAFY65_17015 [Pseudomonadota bacterium]
MTNEITQFQAAVVLGRGAYDMHTLRDRLRAETRLTLEAADRAIRGLDPMAATDVTVLLASHRDVFAAMARSLPDDPLTDVIRDSVTAVQADLAHGATDLTPQDVPPPNPDHAIAQRFVWQAARMGTRMFARRWQDSPLAQHGLGATYLTSAQSPVPAAPFLESLEARDALDPDAPAILRATNGWFAQLEDCVKAHARAARKG